MMKTIVNISTALFSVLLLGACGGMGFGGSSWSLSDDVSTTTGWAYNDPEYGGFQTGEYNVNQIPVGMVFVEGGVFDYGQSDEDITFSNDMNKRRVSVSSFFMDQYEVTNRAWQEYLHWLHLVYGVSNPEILKRAQPDQTVWRSELSYNEPMLENYFSHSSYSFYPVVGVSWDQANRYCEWRTDRVNEKILKDRGMIELPDFASLDQSKVFTLDRYLNSDDFESADTESGIKDAFGNTRKVTFSDGILLPRFRLPTEVEWEYAAYAIYVDEGTNVYGDKRVFPWDGHGLRASRGRRMGEFNANFVRGKGDYMGQAGRLNDAAIYTVPVDAYDPNDFGLYNMAGNVNEWVADIYRPMNPDLVGEYNPYRGNVFTKAARDANGNVLYDEEGRVIEEVLVDTINGIATERDYRNYKDGSLSSSLDRNDWNKRGLTVDEQTRRMYGGEPNTPDGLLSSGLTNDVRIYKGGSWADRVYWLNPGVKRYLEQDKSSSRIGFRCAMDRIGPERMRR